MRLRLLVPGEHEEEEAQLMQCFRVEGIKPNMSLNAFTDPPSDPASCAANRSGLDASGAASADLLQALAQANGFTLEDVQANRQGWMSPRQRTGVVRRTIGCLFWLLILVGSVVSGAVPALGVTAGGFWPLLLGLLGLAVYALLSLTLIGGARQQLRDGCVAFMDGFVERERKESSDSDTGGTTTSYSYVLYHQYPSGVNQQRFSVAGAAYYALVPGLRYRIYYLPGDHELLSIEPLP